ncbi:MAG: MBL fold metallo-hydrolase [Candidatus Heimdallarchaeaceae archaeon]
MNVQKVKNRGFLFTFLEPYKTNVYVINGSNSLFICDTFLGPKSMKEVLIFLEKKGLFSKRKIIFNTHYDYDHFWGNQLFADDIILSHELCYRKIIEVGEQELRQYTNHQKGEVKLTLPNLIFSERVSFPSEQVEFFFSPGHTPDSASCYDSKDKVLIVGDNIESPLPYLREDNFDDYIGSLEGYLSRNIYAVVSGHDDLMMDTMLIQKNLSYLKSFRENSLEFSEMTNEEKIIHFMNLKSLGKFSRENKEKEKSLQYFKDSLSLLAVIEEKKGNKIKQEESIKQIITEISSDL